MRTLGWKLAVIVLCGILIELYGRQARPILFSVGLMLIPALFALTILGRFSPAILSCLPAHSLSALLIPLLILAIASSVKRPEPQPPDLWFSFSSEEPDYEHRILATARIRESINPGLYFASIKIHSYDRDLDPSFYGKQWEYAAPPGFRGGPELFASRYENPFLTALSVDSENLYQGCSLRLQVYGRGVPDRPYGGFGDYLRSKGAKSYLRVYNKWHVLESHCPPDFRATLRSRLFDILNRDMSRAAAQVSRAILLGESGWMDRDLKQAARRLGILHLFAASGLHLGIFYGVFFLPIAWKTGRKHPAALFLPLVPCAFYVWTLYFPVSLCRAFVFLTLIAIRSLVHRPVDVYHHLANTALVLLVLDPGAFYSLSGYLSFGAVSGILLFYRPLEQGLFKASHWTTRLLRSQLALSLSATLFIAPLLLWTFKEQPFTAHLSNIIMVPFTGLILPPVYLMVSVQLILPAGLDGPMVQGLHWLWGWVAQLMEGFVWLTRTLSQYSILVEYSGIWNFAFLLSWISILLIFTGTLLRRRRSGGILMRIAFLLMLAGGAVSLLMADQPGQNAFFGQVQEVESR
ncbi:MAG: ComEC/Rec2 family competence protein [Leptospiraceae bacterium]|nr:ComEC/Rec2 family competence protein [Leptospiraceae bacterium]